MTKLLLLILSAALLLLKVNSGHHSLLKLKSYDCNRADRSSKARKHPLQNSMQPVNGDVVLIRGGQSAVASDLQHDDTIRAISQIWQPLVQHASTNTSAVHSVDESLRANGTDKESFSKQLVAQFVDPLAVGGKRAAWLDQEFTLMLKGLAVLAHFPGLTQDIGEGLTPRLTKGVRFSLTDVSVGMLGIQQQIVRALAASLDSAMVELSARTLELVRDKAVELQLPRKLLTKANILKALFVAINDSKQPAVVVLPDRLTWLTSNADLSALLLEQFQNAESRVFFVQLASELSTTVSGTSSRPNQVSNNNNEMDGSNGMPGFFTPNMQQPFPFLPPPPPGFMMGPEQGRKLPSHGQSQNNLVMGRSFQVVLQNGSATMVPIPHNAAHPGLPPGMIPAPPEPVMRKIIAEHQRIMQNMAKEGGADQSKLSNPPASMFPPGFPTDMTEDDLNEFLSDPENEAKIKSMLESVINMISKQISQHMENNPQLFGEGGPMNPFQGSPPPYDVRLHMMQLPMPGMPMPMSGAPVNIGDDDITNDSNNNSNSNNNDNGIQSEYKDLDDDQSADDAEEDDMFSMDRSNNANLDSAADDSGLHVAEVKRASQFDESSVSNEEKKAGSFSMFGNRLPGFFRGMKGNRGDSEDRSSNNNVDAKQKDRLESQDKTDAKTSNSEDRSSNVISGPGKELMQKFETLVLEPPRDHNLRGLWDQMCEDERSSRIVKANKRLLNIEFKRNRLRRAPGSIGHLEDILKRQLLNKEEVRRALLIAVKLQAGLFDARKTAKSNALESTRTSTAESDPVSSAASVIVEKAADNAVTEEQQENVEKNDDAIVLSTWALDTALSAIVQVAMPRLGKPMARSKDEINNMQLDKHEKSLVANVISPQDIGVTYDMIGGLHEVKDMLRQCITYPLKYPRLYQEGVAAEAVKGVLLFGPPGTGKTMLAKAVATEGGATFLSIDTSTIENKWLGESEKNARAVFTLARRLAPCVIYLDEVDSILSSREHGDESSHGTLTSVKTTLMQEWDGLRTTKDRVVVIASTNRPFDLDEAVLRRLPRRIMVDLPDLETRREILAVTLSGNRVAADVNMTKLAENLEGFTGSDIKEVCREAVVRVSHERAQMIESGAHHHHHRVATFVASDEQTAAAADINTPLRPVSLDDFRLAMRKLKASVNEGGRELQKVVDWNDRYGEIKRKSRKATASMPMYI